MDRLFYPDTKESGEKELERLMPLAHYDPASTTLEEQRLLREKMHEAICQIKARRNITLQFPDYLPESMFVPRDGNIYFKPQPRFLPMPHHAHEYYEIVYLEYGTCMHFVGSQAVRMQAGDVMFVPPGIPHTLALTDWSCQAYSIGLRASTLPDSLYHIHNLPGETGDFFRRSWQARAGEGYLLYHADEEQRALVTLRWLLAQDEEAFTSQYFTTLLELAILELSQFGTSVMHLDIAGDTIGEQIAHYISKHFATVTRTELSDVFSYSGRQIIRLLKEYTGMSFNDYRTDVRMKYICDALESTNLSVTEIITSAGYQNNNFFYDMFKARYNMTPSEYRAIYQA